MNWFLKSNVLLLLALIISSCSSSYSRVSIADRIPSLSDSDREELEEGKYVELETTLDSSEAYIIPHLTNKVIKKLRIHTFSGKEINEEFIKQLPLEEVLELEIERCRDGTRVWPKPIVDLFFSRLEKCHTIKLYVDPGNVVLWDSFVEYLKKGNKKKKYQLIRISAPYTDNVKTVVSENNQERINATISALSHCFVKELCFFRTSIDSLPAEISEIRGLKELYLQKSNIVSLPNSISELKQLKWLSCIDNRMTSLPLSVCELKKLKVLELGGDLAYTFPEEIVELKTLKGVFIYESQLTKFPSQLLRMKGLVAIMLADSDLTSLPEEIGDLRHLKYLELDGNRLTNLPKSMERLVNLKTLDLSGNSIPEEEIEALQRKLPRCEIDY